MNFYYAACVCHSVWLFLLILLTTSESWKCITWRSKMNMFSHCKTDLKSLNFVFRNLKKSAQQIAHIEFVCLFFLTLDDNSNWIVTGRFPTILPGKHECRWTFELLSFINLDHMRRFGIVTYKKLACVHTCSFQQIVPILLLFWRLSKKTFRGSPK